MKVYNGDAAHGEYYSYQCDCGCWVMYKQKYCHHCGAKLDWSKMGKMEKELDRRCTEEPVKYYAMYGGNVYVSDSEV